MGIIAIVLAVVIVFVGDDIRLNRIDKSSNMTNWRS